MTAKLDWPIPAEWSALGGKWTMQVGNNADFFTRNQVVLIVEHRFPAMWNANVDYWHLRAYHYAAWLPVSQAFMDHFGADRYLNDVLFRVMDRHFRPWLYPRPIPFPTFDLFPRWTRFRSSKWFRRR